MTLQRSRAPALKKIVSVLFALLLLSAIVVMPVAAAGTTPTSSTAAAGTTTQAAGTDADADGSDAEDDEITLEDVENMTFWERLLLPIEMMGNVFGSINDEVEENGGNLGGMLLTQFIGNLFGPEGTFYSYIGSFWDGTWRFIWSKLATMFLDLFAMVSQTMGTTFFSSDFVKHSLDFFGVLGGILLTVGFVKNLIVCAEKHLHGEPSNPSAIIMDTLKAYGLLIFCRPVVMATWEFVSLITNLIVGTPDVAAIEQNFLNGFIAFGAPLLLETILLLAMLIATIVVVWNTLKQFAVMYVQIFSGYLHVFDVAGGNSSAIGEWGRDMFASRITWALQYIFYHIGLLECANSLSASDSNAMTVSLILFIGATAIPGALKRWGYTASAGRGTMGQIASGAMSLLRYIK